MSGENVNKNIIISLFDASGVWSKPYKEQGYEVIQIDLEMGIDILKWDYKQVDKNRVYGILNASPCTDFALSGARWFNDKDNDGRTKQSVTIAKRGLDIIEYFKPDFWVLENPMTRIHKVIPEIGEVKFKFDPCDFAGWLNDDRKNGERYNKKTWLFGDFKLPEKKRLEPLQKDSPMWVKGDHQFNFNRDDITRQKLRSITPEGFAYAFYHANNNLDK